jgi:hypothetical protein
LAALFVAWIAVSCGSEVPEPSPEPAPSAPEPTRASWPEGTALTVGSVPILASEVDRIAHWIPLFDPGKTEPDYRRRALTAVLLQRAALADHFAEARAEALATAVSQLERLRTQSADAPSFQTADGGWSTLGLVIWGETRDLPIGSWAGPFEDSGRILLLRPTAAHPGKLPGNDEFTIDIVELLFVPPDFTPEAAQEVLESSKLTILDPKIGDLVPAMWRYWMNASR